MTEPPYLPGLAELGPHPMLLEAGAALIQASGYDVTTVANALHVNPNQLIATVHRARQQEQATANPLLIRGVKDLCAAVDAAGPRRYLIRGIWPAGAYGVHAAEAKAQKTWNGDDLAVSVASGTPWLGRYPVDDPGLVLIFVGEGGDAAVVRRLRGIAAARGLTLEDLPLRVCTRSPHLTDPAHHAQLADELWRNPPRAVIIDPLYLAVGGADHRSLYGMGEVLERPQLLCEDARASLIVVTHFNRKEGRGPGRVSGAGPVEWGRVLLNGTIKSRRIDPSTMATTVVTEIDAIGGEIPDQRLRLTRTVRAEIPDDLDSPLRYEVTAETVEDKGSTDEAGGMPPARRKLLTALNTFTRPALAAEIVDVVAKLYNHGLTRTTVSEHLNALLDAGMIDAVDQGRGRAKLWLPIAAQPEDLWHSDGDE